VFDLDGECKFIKTKHYTVVIQEICSWLPPFCKQNLLLFIQPRWQLGRTSVDNYLRRLTFDRRPWPVYHTERLARARQRVARVNLQQLIFILVFGLYAVADNDTDGRATAAARVAVQHVHDTRTIHKPHRREYRRLKLCFQLCCRNVNSLSSVNILSEVFTDSTAIVQIFMQSTRAPRFMGHPVCRERKSAENYNK